MRRVAIVGAGAAGCLTAVHLLRSATMPLSIELLDPAERVGRGVAFGTTDPEHLLNVPAAGMSAFPDRPNHFVEWLDDLAGPDDFVPRMRFGDYLEDVLADAIRSAPESRVRHRRDRVARLPDADAIVVATGLPATGTHWAPGWLLASPRFVADPWQGTKLSECLASRDPLVIVGSGLTAVDLVLSALARHGDRVMTVVSRSRRWPWPHTVGCASDVPDVSTWGSDLAGIRRHAREHLARSHAHHGDWRVGANGLREVSAELWQRLGEHDRLEFLARDAGEWNRIRHRVPPSSWAALQRVLESGQVTMTDQPVGSVASASTWVLNGTGPVTDVRRLGDPFVDALFSSGLAVPATGGLGVRTVSGRLVGADGRCRAPIWTLGAWRRGELWESTAIPEIRAQAAALGPAIVAALSEEPRWAVSRGTCGATPAGAGRLEEAI